MTTIFCAIDTPDLPKALMLAKSLYGTGVSLKLGLEFFTACGADGVRAVQAVTERPIFLDLKLHDIPHTVAATLRVLRGLSVGYVTVHTSGGLAMLQAAQDAVEGDLKLLGVTVLTSLREADLSDIGWQDDSQAVVKRLAGLAHTAGLYGVVCSGLEASMLRDVYPGLKRVVPGIRPTGSDHGDQQRVLTPQDAVAAGADYLVIGRPITQAADPRAAAVDAVTNLQLPS